MRPPFVRRRSALPGAKRHHRRQGLAAAIHPAPRILLTQAIHPQADRQLATLGEVAVAADTAAETLRREARDCDVIVVRAPLPEDIFTAAPRLIGAVRHGAGVDMIPVEMASAHGVLVANVPGC